MEAPSPLVCLAEVAAGVVVTLARMWSLRSQGVRSYVLPSEDDAHGFLGNVFKLVMLVLPATLLTIAIWPEIRPALGQLAWLSQPLGAWIGVGIAGIGVGILAIAQIEMGSSWRIGFLPGEHTQLVTSGSFRVSRNPIFLGMIAIVAGAFLSEPNAVLLSLVAVSWVSASAQVRLEEAHLVNVHKDAYRAYRARVRRWL